MATLALIIDILLLLLMGFAIIFAFRLSKQLKVFRANRDAFLKAVQDLDQSADRAEQAILGLRKNAEESGRMLQGEIDEARRLFDELNFMNDAGNSLASRLEKLAGAANKTQAGGAEPQDMSQKKRKSAIMKDDKAPRKPSSKAEEELLKALRDKKK